MLLPLKQFKDALGRPIGQVGHYSRFPEEIVAETKVSVEQHPFVVTQYRPCGHEHIVVQLPTMELAMALARRMVAIVNKDLATDTQFTVRVAEQEGEGEGLSLTELIEALERLMFTDYEALEASTKEITQGVADGTITKGSRIGYSMVDGRLGFAEVLHVHELIVFALPLGPELLLAKIKKDPVLMFERKMGHSSQGGRMLTEDYVRQRGAPEPLPEFVVRPIRQGVLEGHDID